MKQKNKKQIEVEKKVRLEDLHLEEIFKKGIFSGSN